MRYPPRYPEIPEDKPINYKKILKWLFIFIGSSLFLTNIIVSNIKIENKVSLLMMSVIIPVVVLSIIFLIFLFLKELNNHNNELFKKQFNTDNEKWWLYHSVSIPIKTSIIIGSIGENQQEWKQIIDNRPTPPQPISNNHEQRIYCSALVGNKHNREKMLAKLLANQFIMAEEDNKDKIKIDNIYWKGTPESLTQFIEYLQKYDIPLPLKTIFINSIGSLDTIIDNYYFYHKADYYSIVAGSNISDHLDNGVLAETGFLWVISPQEKVYQLHRCECLNHDDANELASQVIKYSKIPDIPDNNISIDKDASHLFLTTPLYSSDNIVQNYFGDSTYTSPFLAISFSILYCINNDINSCGWISGYDNGQYIAGVIKKYENQ